MKQKFKVWYHKHKKLLETIAIFTSVAIIAITAIVFVVLDAGAGVIVNPQ